MPANNAPDQKPPDHPPSGRLPVPQLSLDIVDDVTGGRRSLLDRLLAVFGRRGSSVRDGLSDILAGTSGSSLDFSAQERALLRNVLSLRETKVVDVMVPRADIVAVASDITLGDLLRVFRTAGHSRLPVYGETLDDPKGMVHIRDYLDHLAARAESGRGGRGKKVAPEQSLGRVDLSVTLASVKILRPVLYVPPSMPAVALLRRMQSTRTHMALVIDEYGGTDGLVSIEDLVEIVVGEIEDEHDDEEGALVSPTHGGAFIASARATLEEVSAALGIDLEAGEDADEVDTIGGLVVTIAGRVPSRGELIAGPNGLEFEVLDADPRRVKRVRIRTRTEPGRPAAPPAPADKPAAATALDPAGGAVVMPANTLAKPADADSSAPPATDSKA